MLVTGVNGTTQLDLYGPRANPPAANPAGNNDALPQDTVTLSPAAQAQQDEQRILAREQAAQLAQDGAQAENGDAAQDAAITPQQQAAQLWMSTLALTRA